VTEYSAILPKKSDNHIPIENANSCIFVPLPNIIDLFYVPITEISKFMIIVSAIRLLSFHLQIVQITTVGIMPFHI